MRGEAKRFLGQGVVDLALILIVLRQSSVNISPPSFLRDEALQREAFYDEGPLLGAVPPRAHHFQQLNPWETPGVSQKYIEAHHDAEYEAIMRTIRSQPPAWRSSINSNGGPQNVVTMILSLPNNSSPWQQRNGGVQVTRSMNFQTEGAVGGVGIGAPYSSDEVLDVFNTDTPENMGDDEIQNLLLTNDNGSSNSNQNPTFPDINWQQFVADYDNTFDNFRGPIKSMDMCYENWGNSDILSEAMQSAELFLPLPTSEQSSMDLNTSASPMETSNPADFVTSSRLELIEYSEWASQNHEDDLLFPSLPPPSYEEVMTTSHANSSVQNISPHAQQRSTNHMHDHNYFDSTRTPPPSTTSAQSTSYAIRSRLQVSTRVITAPPRPRHVSAGSDSGVSSAASDTIDLTTEFSSDEATRLSSRHISTSPAHEGERAHENESNTGYSLDSFETKPADPTYFDTLSKDVGLHREVILCN